MKKILKKIIPTLLLKLFRIFYWSWGDAVGKHGAPPAYLRYKVHGHLDIPLFLSGGEKNASCLLAAIKRAGMKLKDDLTVLDFGCGPGGTLMAFGEKTSPGAKLFGTDIDASAIKWCSKYLKKGHFTINSNEPPMAFENNFFDIIFAVSVFTHLNEQYQFDWLRDLHRIAKPGALLLLTVHGALAPAWKNIPQHQKDIFDKQGYYYYRNDGWGLFFPDFYHTTFHSKEYINKTWASFFNVLDIWELGLGGHQDIVSLIKK